MVRSSSAPWISRDSNSARLPLNPYEQFKNLTPVDVVDSSVFVYDGHFEIPLAAALAHAQRVGILLGEKKRPEALQEAQQAVALAPDSARVNAVMGTCWMRSAGEQKRDRTTNLHCSKLSPYSQTSNAAWSIAQTAACGRR